MIKLILAVDQDNKIGYSDGRLAWHIKEDMKRFKELTTGSNIVMGRKTFDSFQKPNGLPNRKNIVLSNTVDYSKENNNVFFINNIEKIKHLTNNNFWVIGGAQIYEMFLPFCDEIYLTQIHQRNILADIQLQTDLYNWKSFVLQQQKLGILWSNFIEYPQKENKQENEPDYTFVTLQRFN